MKYLSEHGIVHRDLAARNLLVSTSNSSLQSLNITVKVADFGLSSPEAKVEEDVGYKHFALAWLAKETILTAQFSFYSDIWSFGVTMWEIFTGKKPYEGISTEEIKKRITNNQLLTIPSSVPEGIAVIMRNCWKEVPLQRPSFDTIHKDLLSNVVPSERKKFDDTLFGGKEKLPWEEFEKNLKTAFQSGMSEKVSEMWKLLVVNQQGFVEQQGMKALFAIFPPKTKN
jgi:serine/threonine protein kinase